MWPVVGFVPSPAVGATQNAAGVASRPCMVYNLDMWKVDLTLIEEWLDGLDEDSLERVSGAVTVLKLNGPQLGRPLVDGVKGSEHKKLKELRPTSSSKSAIRILFAFDSNSEAITLVAGNKAGNWDKWYKKNVPIADALLNEHEKKRKDK